MNKLKRLDQLVRRMNFAREKTETEASERKRTQAWMLFNRCFMEIKMLCKAEQGGKNEKC